MKILICGAGYVGLANALMLSSKNQVTIYEIDDSKISRINSKDYSFLDEKKLEDLPIVPSNINAIDEYVSSDYDFVIIALPTNSDKNGKLDVSNIIELISDNKKKHPESIYIIRSTLPINGSKKIYDSTGEFIYMPEFLREGTAVFDSFYPSRIVIGGPKELAVKASTLFNNCILNKPETIITNHKEAECIKLFSNTFLAMRVAFFNELDTFFMNENLDSDTIIHGIGLDDRIGLFYNNPSFGFGGYCLPKDTEEVINSLDSKLISQINKSNLYRIENIVKHLLNLGHKKIGVYKLSAKSGANGIRNSSTVLLIGELKKHGIEVIVYDSSTNRMIGYQYAESVIQLFEMTDLVIANRIDDEIKEYKDKVFTRDLFARD
ncbi:MAG: nucleotide sugar dehydrogenase [Acholeplasmataceae bacterium]|nr:nucleotide sugar dehydrogenase [Acholeplasmataceae bacterium]